ncbi:MAG: PD-(D/E)XK nuclease family protein [Candidatus Kapaibacteriales bacterium]
MSFIIYNDAFANKYELIPFDDFLNLIIEKNNFVDFCFVLATNRLVNYFKLDVAKRIFERKNKPLTGLVALNLENFLLNAFSYFFPKDRGKIISDAYRFVLFEEAYDKSDLEFYSTPKRKKNLFLIKWLSDIIFGLKEDGIRPEQMAIELGIPTSKIVSFPKFRDTQKLFEKYESILQESGLIDRVDIIFRVNNQLREILDENQGLEIPYLKKGNTLIFYGFYDFKEPEIELLTLLMKFRNPIAIYLDFDEDNGPLFGNYIKILATLVSKGYKSKDLSFGTFKKEKEPYSIFLRKYLFNNFEHFTKPSLSNFIHIYAAENRYEEVKSIVKLCKYLLKVKGIHPKDICIVTKSPEKYSSIFREVFLDAEVPSNITERFKLSTSPLVISILNALKVVVNGYRYTDIRKVLQSYYFDFYNSTSDGKNEVFDLDNFLYVVNTFRLIGGEEFGGKKYWELRFKNRIEFLQKRKENIKNSGYEDETELFEVEKTVQRIEKAYKDIQNLFSFFDFENKEYYPNEFRDLIYKKIILRFGVIKKLQTLINRTFNEMNIAEYFDKIRKIEEVERDSRALVRFLKVLEELVFVLHHRYPSQKFKLSNYLEYLKLMVFGERFQISRKENYGITVTTIEQTRGIPFRVMIMCGMVDGEFPLRYNPEIFLGKELKKTESRHFENERLEFFFFLNNSPKLLDRGEKLIYIFYPKSDGRRELVPSIFIDYLVDLIGIGKDEIVVDINSTKEKINTLDNEKHSWLKYSVSKKDLKFLPNQLVTTASNYSLGNKFKLTKLSNRALFHLKKITQEPISASFLEDYVKCPFQFFAHRILGFKKSYFDLNFFLTNLEKGLIMHYIVASFYKELSQKEYISDFSLQSIKGEMKFHPVELTSKEKDRYLKLLRKKADEILNRFDYGLQYFEIDRSEFWGSEEGKLGLIPLWLSYELKRFEESNCRYLPTIFELQFGMRKHGQIQPIKIKTKNGETLFKLKGKIDRVDFIFQNKPENKELQVLITDYKLTKSECKKLSEALNGRTFQMPVYAISVEEILRKYFGIQNLKISLTYQVFDYTSDDKSFEKNNNLELFYESPLTEEIEGKKNKGKEKIPYDEFKNRIIRNITEIIKTISIEPNFPVKPLNQFTICSYCNFKFICKKEIF